MRKTFNKITHRLFLYYLLHSCELVQSPVGRYNQDFSFQLHSVNDGAEIGCVLTWKH